VLRNHNTKNMQTRIIVTDTETAGLDPKDGVVEIAILELDQNLEVIASHYSLIDPEGPISPSASGVHGIVYDDVKDAPTLSQFFDMNGIQDYCHSPLIVIGHNVKFDIGFLANHLRGEIRPVCTLRLARALYKDVENHKLQTLRYQLGLEAGSAHSAHGDAILCLNFLYRMIEETGYSLEELEALSVRPLQIEKMPFGKHKGMPLCDLPTSYRNWLLDKAEIDNDLRHSLMAC
jgi:exodeoxyribonuclease X